MMRTTFLHLQKIKEKCISISTIDVDVTCSKTHKPTALGFSVQRNGKYV